MKCIILLILIASLLVACGGAGLPSPNGESTITSQPGQTRESSSNGQLVRGDAPRIESPEVSSETLKDLVQGNNAFAFDLYHRVIGNSQENLIYSPYSVSLAFSMVYAGARGETETEIRQVFYYLPQDGQHPAFNQLDQHLTRLGKEQGNEVEGRPFELNIANAVWGQAGFPFRDDYLTILTSQYGAGLRVVDFSQDPEGARQMVNDWVAEETNERIENIVPQGVIDATTRLVLANAIYFNAGWLFPFDKSATQEKPFNLLDDSQVNVQMMHKNTVRMPYLQGEGFQAALIPYTGGKVDMLVILPEEGMFDSIEEGLKGQFFDQIRAQAEVHDVTLGMPKFEFESDLNLPDFLMAMGMLDAFSPGEADFSGMAEGRDLYISAALHKGSITVDELGTEAAAATVIAMAESAMARAEMTIDRPFIFAILERDVGTVLFLGRVINPAG